MLIQRENKFIHIMPLQSQNTSRMTHLQNGACCNISQVFARFIKNIQDFIYKLFCGVKKTPVNPPMAVVIPTATQAGALPETLPQPQVEHQAVPDVAEVPQPQMEAPAVPEIVQIPLPQDESDSIDRLSYAQVVEEIATFDAWQENYREDYEEQYRLSPEERDPDVLARSQRELGVADARMVALQARKAHLEAILVPQHVLDEIAHMNAVRVQDEIGAIHVNIEYLMEQYEDLPRQQWGPLLGYLDETYARLRHLEIRRDALDPPDPEANDVEEQPVLLRQRPLLPTERNEVDIMNLDQVNEAIRQFPNRLAAMRRALEQQYQLPPEERVRHIIDFNQEELEIADATLLGLRIRKIRLETFVIPQDELDAIPELVLEEVNFKINQLPDDIRNYKRQLTDAEGEERRGVQDELDTAYALLPILRERRAALNRGN